MTRTPGHTADTGRSTDRVAARGPLVVSTVNPRYFAVEGSDELVYLTGSHVWNNFHDGLGPGAVCAGVPERNDYDAYLRFLVAHGHNFIRLWRWEHFASSVPGFHLCMTPQPWQRTGPGVASDGLPRFDLSALDDGYFGRLRHRVRTAGEAGTYVAVMLFEGFALHVSEPPNNVAGHPFAAGNNCNGVAVAAPRDYQSPDADERILELQRAYVRKVIDTVQDLPNVLYEIVNEAWPGSVDWQYQLIADVKQYERERDYSPHPVGMTFVYPNPTYNAVLFDSPADWISPGLATVPVNDPWFLDPPANDGTKVVLSDTDHYAAGRGDAPWAWRTFLRGHQPVLMDYGIIDVVDPLDSAFGVPSYESFEPARLAMGDTARYARRLRLATMSPRGELASTGYALAEPGVEYLVLQPATVEPFTVELPIGTYDAAWFDITARREVHDPPLNITTAGPYSFRCPANMEAGAVLHLKRTST